MRPRCLSICSPGRRILIAYMTSADPDDDNISVWRVFPRTGLHLCLPLAAHSGRDDGRRYDHHRLPRLARRAARQAEKGRARPNQGDCIDCMACVNVCPMGIDIRNGQQMECITCGLCIDACDEVMDRIGKPRGLVAYMALSDQDCRARASRRNRSGSMSCARAPFFTHDALGRDRHGLVVALFIRADLDMSVAPVRNPTHIVCLMARCAISTMCACATCA
jgi:ferredoxin